MNFLKKNDTDWIEYIDFKEPTAVSRMGFSSSKIQ